MKISISLYILVLKYFLGQLKFKFQPRYEIQQFFEYFILTTRRKIISTTFHII